MIKMLFRHHPGEAEEKMPCAKAGSSIRQKYA
jgi:hypothetical protein